MEMIFFLGRFFDDFCVQELRPIYAENAWHWQESQASFKLIYFWQYCWAQ